ncbi:MAG: hypothetical protein RMX97_02665 [Nostoc sp. DedQUE11]|nr:hypothetical protein [Nostoc sp. DedQUE11]
MGRRLSAAELEDRAKVARAREEARTTRRVNSTRTPQRAEDTIAVYYGDPLSKGDAIYKINVPESNLFVLGASTTDAATGITRAGLRTAPPDNSDPIEITKGSKLAIVRMNWYKGDANVSRETTPWNSVWFKRYDAQTINGRSRSHFSVPFSKAEDVITIDEIIDRFNALFTGGGSIKDALIGDLGEATLTMGYGSQYSILARVR